MAHCFTPIRGRRMRVTRVNNLGRPVYGPNAFAVTGGFISIQMSPEVSEGEEIEIKTASGEICVAEKSCDTLRWWTVQIEFCRVDPCLFTLINDSWTELRDCVGDVVGWAESSKFSCDSGYALEIWTDVTGYVPSTPGATGAWGYLLLPFVVGGALSEQTIENGAVSFTMTGRTKVGSGWGRGPHVVQCNDPQTGACGPLLTPVGPDEPRRIMLTTCPPPEAACGCQPLNDPSVPAPTIAEDDTDATRMSTMVTPAPTGGPYHVVWGDGSEGTLPAAGSSHKYTRPGTYTICVYPEADKTKQYCQQVTVPYSGATGRLTATVSELASDQTGMSAQVTWDNTGFGTVKINWGTGADVTGQAEKGSATNQYAAGGTYTVTVTDENDPARTATQQITVPSAIVPQTTVAEDSAAADPDRRSVVLTVPNAREGRTYEVQWETGDPWVTLATAADYKHKYAAAGTKRVTVRDKVDTTKVSTPKDVVVPFA